MSHKRARREGRQRFREKWNVAVAKLAMLGPELYDLCRRISYAVKGVPDAWPYQSGTDLVEMALHDLGLSNTSKTYRGHQSKWLMQAFMRCTSDPGPLHDASTSLHDDTYQFRKDRAARAFDMVALKARVATVLENRKWDYQKLSGQP